MMKTTIVNSKALLGQVSYPPQICSVPHLDKASTWTFPVLHLISSSNYLTKRYLLQRAHGRWEEVHLHTVSFEPYLCVKLFN